MNISHEFWRHLKLFGLCFCFWEALNIKKVQRYAHTLLRNWSNDWGFRSCVRHIYVFLGFFCLAGADSPLTLPLNFRWFNWTSSELFSHDEVIHASFIHPEWQRERVFFFLRLFYSGARQLVCCFFFFWSALALSINTTTPQRWRAGDVLMADQANQVSNPQHPAVSKKMNVGAKWRHWAQPHLQEQKWSREYKKMHLGEYLEQCTYFSMFFLAMSQLVSCVTVLTVVWGDALATQLTV